MNRLTPWLLAGAAGITLALALPGPSWAPLVLLFPGLLLEALERAPGSWQALLLGWFAGTVHWAVATNWVLPVMHHYGGLPVGLAAICLILMAAYVGLTWAACAWLTSLVPCRLRPWLFPAVWIAIEAARQLPPYVFPWNPTAAVVAHWPILLTSLPVWGATGLGWAVVAFGSGLWALIRRDRRRRGFVCAGIAGVLAVAFGIAAPEARPNGSRLQIAVIQPDTTLEEKWDPTQVSRIVDLVWSLTRRAATAGAEVVLWPESAVPAVLDTDPGYRDAVIDLARELDVTIVLNSIGSGLDGYTNSAYAVTAEGIATPRYDKVRLVPFGEYVPAVARFAFAESLVREVPRFTPGNRARPLPAQRPLGIFICYEVVFPDLVAAGVRDGAEVLTTLTNDAWYGFSWAPHQHFAQAVLRAAETRRWLARAALTGVSGFVDPTGRTRQRLELGTSGVLVQAVEPSNALTPRVRWGDWWALLCAVSAAGMILASFHPGAPMGTAQFPRRKSATLMQDQDVVDAVTGHYPKPSDSGTMPAPPESWRVRGHQCLTS